MLREVHHAFRSLLRRPGYSILVIVTLALGIGATSTIFSVVHGVLLRPLPFFAADRLLMLWQRAPGVGVAEDWFSPTQYFDIRERVRSFEQTALVHGSNVTLSGDSAEPERVGALEVSSSFFDLFGIEPLLGRALSYEDDLPGAARKVLLTRRLYERRFGADPIVVGRTIRVDGERLEVVGVLPPLPLDADVLPTLATVPVFDLVLSLPVEDPGRTTHGSENYNVVARRAATASLGEVEAELLNVASDFVKDPESLGSGLTPGTEYRIGAVPLLDQVVGPVRSPLYLLLAATAVLLLIACANVANLVLTRAASGHRELALRTAIGASRLQILLESLLPSVVLGLSAGLAGLGIAFASVRALRAAAPPDLPRLAEIEVDLGVAAFTAAVSVGASLLFGLGPALRISRVAPADALREGAAAVRARSLFRSGSRYLVIAQVALSLVLAMGAGLLLRTLRVLQSVDPGFSAEGALTFRVSLAGDRYQERGARDRFFELVFDRLRGTAPGNAAGGISMLPLTRGFAWTDFTVQDQSLSPDRDRVVADVHVVTPGYFEAMGIPVLAGRSFEYDDDNEPPIALVNRALAERFWQLEDAVGKWVSRRPEDRVTIVGVVEDVKHYGLGTEPRMTVFFPYEAYASRTLFGVVRSSKSEQEVTSRVTEAVRALDPEVPVYDIRPMTDRVGASLTRQRVLMSLLLLLSAVALILATIGLYGVLSYTVATQTRELGIRKAIGASQIELYWVVGRGAGRVLALGTILGLTASLVAGRFIEALLFGVRAHDPVSLLAASLGLLAVGIVATLVPAQRAAAVEPIQALKEN
ncbi:MAG TPA: ABC transporter permease [Vicinamibacteria bacterium]|nr:ABC transporter permease [Vicinamibacteria bacterium]